MSDYCITCCSTADMPTAFFKENDIPFARFHFHMDGNDYLDDLGETIPFDEFYKRIAEGAMPITSQVNMGEYVALFEPILEQGKNILHISLSSGISGTANSAVMAQKELIQRYPERQIMVVDSLGASSGYGMLVDAAIEMKNRGASLDEVYRWLEDNKLRLHHWFFSTDLSNYKRGGRISATTAVLGALLNICPLMNMNNKGELIPRMKVRGKKHVMQELVSTMEKHAEKGADYAGKCFISNSACLEDAQTVAGMIEERFRHLKGPVQINNVGTAIGAHTGPGTVALFFWGDLRND